MSRSDSLSTGHHLGVEPSSLSFEVIEMKALGRHADTGKECYWVKVKFDNGELIALRTHSKSLKTAFEMIETLGQQTKSLSTTEFQGYMNANRGKRLWFYMAEVSKRPHSQKDQVIVFKRNRQGNFLEHAFSEHKHLSFKSALTLDHTVLAELKKLARLHQSEVDPTLPLFDRNVRLVLKKKRR